MAEHKHRTGKASNYYYGRVKEKQIGQSIKAYEGGTYRRSAGSRGAADVVNHLPNGTVVMTQVKSSRAHSHSIPSIDYNSKNRLAYSAVKYANKSGKPVIAQVVMTKGNRIVSQETVANI